MKKNNGTCKINYGISRIDSERYNTYAWRVSLIRRGKRIVKNFPDKKCGGRAAAHQKAIEYRDQMLVRYPPISRKEFCNAKRRNNRTGITGVYKYSKRYRLKDGTVKESWYWEANWPDANSESVTACFSVKRFGDELAKQKAIRARENGLLTIQGTFWAAERGEVQAVSTIAEPPFALNA